MEEENQSIKQTHVYIRVITTLIAAWLIGMSIVVAGWLISKEISKQNIVQGTQTSNFVPNNIPVNITLPENLPQQGSSDARVTVIEFADFQCPFCGEWHKETYSILKSEYIDSNKINFIFWDFAFLGEESNKAAEAALCAKEQNKYWEYHDKLFESQDGENQGVFSDLNLKKFAGGVGLDQTKFNSCFDSRIYKPIVEDSTKKAGEYGVNSTPTVFINGLKFEGIMPWENYKQIIESELSKE